MGEGGLACPLEESVYYRRSIVYLAVRTMQCVFGIVSTPESRLGRREKSLPVGLHIQCTFPDSLATE